MDATELMKSMGVGVKTEADGGQPGASGSSAENEGGEGAASDANISIDDKNKGIVVDPDAGKQPPATEATELDDAKVLEYLKTKKGKDAKSLDDLFKPAEPAAEATPEEKEAAKKEKRDKAYKYALDKKLFDTDKLQNYLKDSSRTPRDIAFDLFAVQQKQLDDTLTDEKIAERFAELNFEDLDENDYRRVMRAKEMEGIAASYLNSSYGDIIGIEGIYDRHQEIENKAVAYKATLDTVFETVPKEFSYHAVDAKEKIDMNLNFKFSPESIQEVKDRYLAPETFLLLQQGKLDEAALAVSIQQDLFYLNFPKMLPEFLNAYSAERTSQIKMGLKGVAPVREGQPAPTGVNADAKKVMEAVSK